MLAIAVTTIAACGSDEDSETRDTAEPSASVAESTAPDQTSPQSDGLWRGETELGTALVADLFVDPADVDTLRTFESYRVLIGADPVVYGRVDATNSTATDDTGRFLTFTDDSGDLFGDSRTESTFLCSWLGLHWAPGADATQEVIDAYTAIYNGQCADQFLQVPVPAGQTVTYFVVVPEEPEFTRVFAGFGNELTSG